MKVPRKIQGSWENNQKSKIKSPETTVIRSLSDSRSVLLAEVKSFSPQNMTNYTVEMK